MPDQKDDTRKGGNLGDMPGGRGAQGQGPQAEPVEGSPDVGASPGGASPGGPDVGTGSPEPDRAKVFVSGEDASPRGEAPQAFDEDSGLRYERAGYRVTAPDRGDDEED